ncbi:MAG: PIG-L family deacetylase [Bacteroidota bacterium]
MKFIKSSGFTFCLLCIACCTLPVATFSQTPKTYNSSEILLQLKKLKVLGSVLYIAAHPDDENNTLLPYLAKEKLYRTAYLSLTRGDGGQNLIGDEQGIELGLMRTQELLAARRVDGAEQYFTRAYEFGYSKSAEEALRIWDREKILSDIVWVIRFYQPDIIINRFPPDSRAGHGHHAASAVLGAEAYAAAANPNRFPEQFKYGVKPWKAKRLLWNSFNFGGNNTTSEDQFKIDIGGFNPLLGKSYGELGAEARTMHKCQGEGRPRRRGPSIDYFTTLNGDAPKNTLMDDVDISWKRIEGGEKIQPMIDAIISNYKMEQPELSVPALVKMYQAIKALPASTWTQKKLEETQEMIEACSALFVEATSNQSNVVQGDSLKMSFFLNKRTNINATLKNLKLEWLDSNFSTSVGQNQNIVINKTIGVAADKKISQPYWLENPMAAGIFVVDDQLLIGKAENDPSFEASFTLNIEGEDFVVKRPVQYKYTDPTKGDIYQPIPVLPKLEINYVKDNYVSINGAPVKAPIHFKANAGDGASYSITQRFSNAWKNDNPNVTYASKGVKESSATGSFAALNKDMNTTEEIKLVAGSGKYDGYTRTITYDHIPTLTYFAKAKANLVKVDMKTAGKKIGYISGAGDKIHDALEAMGYEVTTLAEADVNDDNLKRFDAVIVGIRAYNVYEWLTNKNDIMNRYVENGGNLIVQYLKSNEVGLKRVKVGPYPFVVNARSRVSEEGAKVNFLLPEHSALNYPNKITEKDFEGWVQERSTYQAEQADSHFEFPLGMNDTGEKEANGSLALAKYGKGNFVYLSLVFFRQLPAGVPGAYRMLANLIALPKVSN